MRPTEEHFSDEILNAYIDGELELEDNDRITAAMETDDILRRRVNDLRKISDLVREAFEDVRPPVHGATRGARAPAGAAIWRAAAGIALVGFGALFGWHLYGHHAETRELQALLTVNQQQTVQDPLKVMFHVGRDDPHLLSKVLNETDRLLSNHLDTERPLSVSVVASHGGLSLFKLALAENAEQVRAIKSKHQDRVSFVGCGETFEKWRSKSGKAPGLVPEVLMVDSGVMELLRRQQQGWTFVSI